MPAFLVSYDPKAFPAVKDRAKVMSALRAVLIARDLWGVEIDGDAAGLRKRLTSQLDADCPMTIVEIDPIGQGLRPEITAWFERTLTRQSKKRTVLMSAVTKKSIF